MFFLRILFINLFERDVRIQLKGFDLTIAQSPRMPSSLSFQHYNQQLWWLIHGIHSVKLTFPLKAGNFESMMFLFQEVGYVSSLEGIYYRVIQNNKGLTLGPRQTSKNCQAALGWISPMILMCGTSHTPGNKKTTTRKICNWISKVSPKMLKLTSFFVVFYQKKW